MNHLVTSLKRFVAHTNKELIQK